MILAFDNENIRNLERIRPKNCKAQIKLITFYNEKNKNKIVEDPWYEDTPQAFEQVYKDCYESCVGLLNSV